MASATIRKRFLGSAAANPSAPISTDPAYEKGREVTVNPSRECFGLTFDGRFFWLGTDSTDRSQPKFVQVDTDQGAVVQEISLNLGLESTVYDLQHVRTKTGSFLLALVHIFNSDLVEIHRMSYLGNTTNRLVWGLPDTARALTWDGQFIYVPYADSFDTKINVYEADGTLRDSAISCNFLPLSQNTGPGIVWDGRKIILRVDPTFAGYTSRNFYEHLLESAVIDNVRIANKEADTANDKVPITHDHYFLYDLTSSP
jgi:hypothetical protein